MPQTTDLVIKDFNLGIGPSPHLGFGDMRNLDVSTIPGIARLNYAPVERSAGVFTGMVKWYEHMSTVAGLTYALDENGVLYTDGSSDGATWTKVLGNQVSISIATPADFSLTSHRLLVGDQVKFTTTGALPTGLTVGTTYFVIAAGLTDGTFRVSTSNGGSAVNTSGSQSGTHRVLVTSGKGQGIISFNGYVIVARNTQLDAYGPVSLGSASWFFNWTNVLGASVTVNSGNPVFTSTAHGLKVDDAVMFITSGALLTGITPTTVYYVIATGLDADHFEISAAPGQSAITPSGSQSGSHTLMYAHSIDADPNFHPMIISKNDNKVYGGAGRYIYSIDENTTFDPTSVATYTFTPRALDLPEGYYIKCLAELGNNLDAGTIFNNTSGGGIPYNYKIAKIFPWDRSSPSFQEPIQLAESGIHQMVTSNGMLYFNAGTDGRYYKTNGVTYVQVAKIPTSIVDVTGTSVSISNWPGAIMEQNGKIFFGLGSDVNLAANLAGMGVWSINVSATGNPLVLENIISNGHDGSTSVVNIGAITSLPRVSPSSLLIGWRDASTYGTDRVAGARYTGYTGYFDSPFYLVGTPLSKRQFQQMEFQLISPLATGQGIKIWYRTNLLGSFTQINPSVLYDFATLGAVSSHAFIPDIPDCEFVQIRAQLTTDTSTALSPELREVRLR